MNSINGMFEQMFGVAPEEWFASFMAATRRHTWNTYGVFSVHGYVGCTLDGPDVGDEVEVILNIEERVLTLGKPGERTDVSIACQSDIDDTLRGLRFAQAMNPYDPVWGWWIDAAQL